MSNYGIKFDMQNSPNQIQRLHVILYSYMCKLSWDLQGEPERILMVYFLLIIKLEYIVYFLRNAGLKGF